MSRSCGERGVILLLEEGGLVPSFCGACFVHDWHNEKQALAMKQRKEEWKEGKS